MLVLALEGGILRRVGQDDRLRLLRQLAGVVAVVGGAPLDAEGPGVLESCLEERRVRLALVGAGTRIELPLQLKDTRNPA